MTQRILGTARAVLLAFACAACAASPARPREAGGFRSPNDVAGTRVHAAVCQDPRAHFSVDLLGYDAVLPVAVRIESADHTAWMGGTSGLEARYYLPDGTPVSAMSPQRLAKRLPRRALERLDEFAWQAGMPADARERYLFFDLEGSGFEFVNGAVQRAETKHPVRYLPFQGLVEFDMRVDGDEVRARVGLIRSGAERGRDVKPEHHRHAKDGSEVLL